MQLQQQRWVFLIALILWCGTGLLFSTATVPVFAMTVVQRSWIACTFLCTGVIQLWARFPNDTTRQRAKQIRVLYLLDAIGSSCLLLWSLHVAALLLFAGNTILPTLSYRVSIGEWHIHFGLNSLLLLVGTLCLLPARIYAAKTSSPSFHSWGRLTIQIISGVLGVLIIVYGYIWLVSG